MNHEKMIEWLKPLVDTIVPVTVTIGQNVYEGLRYSQTLYSLKDDSPYQNDVVIFLGKRPKFKGNNCFRLKNTEQDWYPSWYSPEVIRPEHSRYHPCGHVWTIAPWTPDEPIDRYEKYHRQDLQIVEHTEG